MWQAVFLHIAAGVGGGLSLLDRLFYAFVSKKRIARHRRARRALQPCGVPRTDSRSAEGCKPFAAVGRWLDPPNGLR